MENMASPYEVTPQAAKEKLNDRKQATLIDVREPAEFALARIEGAELDSHGFGTGGAAKTGGFGGFREIC